MPSDGRPLPQPASTSALGRPHSSPASTGTTRTGPGTSAISRKNGSRETNRHVRSSPRPRRYHRSPTELTLEAFRAWRRCSPGLAGGWIPTDTKYDVQPWQRVFSRTRTVPPVVNTVVVKAFVCALGGSGVELEGCHVSDWVYNSRPQATKTPPPRALTRLPSSFCCAPGLPLVLFDSRNPQVQEALSAAAQAEAPFGALDLCVEGYGESRALAMLDDYLTMGEVDFARCFFVGHCSRTCRSSRTKSSRRYPRERCCHTKEGQWS